MSFVECGIAEGLSIRWNCCGNLKFHEVTLVLNRLVVENWRLWRMVILYMGKCSVCRCNLCVVRCEVLVVMSMTMFVCWHVTPCCLTDVYQHFRAICSLYHQASWNISTHISKLDNTTSRRWFSSLFVLYLNCWVTLYTCCLLWKS